MFWLRQTLAVTALNLRTIPQRLGSSAVAIVGIAGVVVVFVAVLSIAAGLLGGDAAARARRGRALVMRSGADSEMTSGLSGAEADIIKQAPGHRARRPAARSRRPSSTSSSTCRRSRRPTRRRTCRCAASSRRHARCATRSRSSRAGCSSSAPTRSSSAAARQRSVRRPERRRHGRCRARTAGTVVGIFEADGARRRNRGVVRRAHAAGRVPARQHLSVACSRGSNRRTSFDTFQRLADDESAAERVRSAARTNTTPASRRR